MIGLAGGELKGTYPLLQFLRENQFANIVALGLSGPKWLGNFDLLYLQTPTFSMFVDLVMIAGVCVCTGRLLCVSVDCSYIPPW